MATDLARAVRETLARNPPPHDALAALEPALSRLFIHEFNNRHSAVTGFVALLKRADALPPGRAKELVLRLEEAADRTGRLAAAYAFLTAPPEIGRTPAADLLAPLERLAAPHLQKMTNYRVEVDPGDGVAFTTAGPLAARLLMCAVARLAAPGGALLVRARADGDSATLDLLPDPGVPPEPADLAAVKPLLAAFPGASSPEPDGAGMRLRLPAPPATDA